MRPSQQLSILSSSPKLSLLALLSHIFVRGSVDAIGRGAGNARHLDGYSSIRNVWALGAWRIIASSSAPLKQERTVGGAWQPIEMRIMLVLVEGLSVKVAGGELRSSASNKPARLATACPGNVDVRFAP